MAVCSGLAPVRSLCGRPWPATVITGKRAGRVGGLRSRRWSCGGLRRVLGEGGLVFLGTEISSGIEYGDDGCHDRPVTTHIFLGHRNMDVTRMQAAGQGRGGQWSETCRLLPWCYVRRRAGVQLG